MPLVGTLVWEAFLVSEMKFQFWYCDKIIGSRSVRVALDVTIYLPLRPGHVRYRSELFLVRCVVIHDPGKLGNGLMLCCSVAATPKLCLTGLAS